MFKKTIGILAFCFTVALVAREQPAKSTQNTLLDSLEQAPSWVKGTLETYGELTGANPGEGLRVFDDKPIRIHKLQMQNSGGTYYIEVYMGGKKVGPLAVKGSRDPFPGAEQKMIKTRLEGEWRHGKLVANGSNHARKSKPRKIAVQKGTKFEELTDLNKKRALMNLNIDGKFAKHWPQEYFFKTNYYKWEFIVEEVILFGRKYDVVRLGRPLGGAGTVFEPFSTKVAGRFQSNDYSLFTFDAEYKNYKLLRLKLDDEELSKVD